jgi:hypothetical protein
MAHVGFLGLSLTKYSYSNQRSDKPNIGVTLGFSIPWYVLEDEGFACGVRIADEPLHGILCRRRQQ